MASLDEHYAATDIEERLLSAIRGAGLDPEKGLSPEDLAALDHFHTGGLRASRELAELAEIGEEDRVLDLGAGLGGAARLLASSYGCRAVCVELTHDYCTGARLLNRLTGLDDRVEVHRGSALELQFPDDSFDVVWMQNVGMNIADKATLYSEIHRVLKPGGRYAFQEMAAGQTPTTYFPLPWATAAGDSALVTGDAMLALLTETGFTVGLFEDTSDEHLNRKSAPSTPGPLTLSAFVDNLGEKANNARRSLEEGQIRLVRGVFRAS